MRLAAGLEAKSPEEHRRTLQLDDYVRREAFDERRVVGHQDQSDCQEGGSHALDSTPDAGHSPVSLAACDHCMAAYPTFFLTAAGEFSPLGRPRVCHSKRRLRGQDGSYFLLVRIEPPMDYDGRTLDEIVLGPFYVSIEEHVQTPYSAYVHLIVSRREPKAWTPARATPHLPWWETLRYTTTAITRFAEIFGDRESAEKRANLSLWFEE